MALFSKSAADKSSSWKFNAATLKRALRASAQREDSIHRLLIDAQTLAGGFPPLNLHIADRANATLGRHGRRRFGHGSDFWQFRNYEWGDSVSTIDWRQSARFDSLQVREREWQAQRALYIWSDPSPSCDWSSARHLPTKRHRAQEILLALAILALRGGESVAVLRNNARLKWGGDLAASLAQELFQESADWSARRAGRAQGESQGELQGESQGASQGKLQGESQQESSRGASPLQGVQGADNLESAATTLPDLRIPDAASHVILAGDFLDPPEPLVPYLKAVSARGATGTLVQVLDPAEWNLPWRGGAILDGTEGESPWKVRRLEEIASAYEKRLADSTDRLRAIARGSGWGYLAHNTADSSAKVLLALHIRLNQRAGQGATQGSGGSGSSEKSPEADSPINPTQTAKPPERATSVAPVASQASQRTSPPSVASATGAR